MTTARYMVRRNGQGYDIRRVSASNPWWTISGACLAYLGMKRRSFPGLLAAGIGLAMIWRGEEAARWMDGELTRPIARVKRRTSGDASPRALRREVGPSYQNDDRGRAAQLPADQVEEASMQSFPASDPPAYMDAP